MGTLVVKGLMFPLRFRLKKLNLDFHYFEVVKELTLGKSAPIYLFFNRLTITLKMMICHHCYRYSILENENNIKGALPRLSLDVHRSLYWRKNKIKLSKDNPQNMS